MVGGRWQVDGPSASVSLPSSNCHCPPAHRSPASDPCHRPPASVQLPPPPASVPLPLSTCLQGDGGRGTVVLTCWKCKVRVNKRGYILSKH